MKKSYECVTQTCHIPEDKVMKPIGRVRTFKCECPEYKGNAALNAQRVKP